MKEEAKKRDAERLSILQTNAALIAQLNRMASSSETLAAALINQSRIQVEVINDPANEDN